ncbi:biotin--[acetyl-CoA-carboxylase] ligase [uncultured Psychroserpens sp.]|uniref:biotin--[acetyl-CoA-carboxylase] ligase n=1 Tax=uncultured Psychroserpens sp. TaxID=255436 RepID=UPI00260ECD9A|nr:biotin--[acetyl-CoA-carboxylase] ligase [uncultured Psychroserpens sp.]
MRIIKLNAIDSTNSFLRQLSNEEPIQDYTVVTSQLQTKGRGQMGTQWKSEAGKNLVFSVFKDVSNINLQHHFYMSMIVSLAVFKALESYKIKNLKIKWPNDILAEQQKISGILIENVIKYNQIQSSIIGIGININQVKFEDLPKATSMQLISGVSFNNDEVLHQVLQFLKFYFGLLKQNKLEAIKEEYESYLFRKEKPSTFKDQSNHIFTGYIKGITNSGNLRILIEDSIVREFDLKEITLVY